MAMGLLRALYEHGRRVPDDVSVVGFDDIPEGAYLTCPLTTVRQPFEQLGRAIMAVVQQTLEGADAPGVVTRRMIPATMVLRSSAGVPTPE
jgi:DNA-binding LacI/PurR family transcriptional regulator